ncbi:hypothetical protein PR048_003614 [Dryococelus australis]|uniref:Uncharacterized protein n=1 Tax=Dryococelus australis TaxID=614101 RepID=A0ABQ9IPU5_9NEOP|nr:hypothetical protein PR048_003614 [Dryococelus australis]
MRVKCGEYGAASERKGRGNRRYPRKPSDQRHRPARYPGATPPKAHFGQHIGRPYSGRVNVTSLDAEFRSTDTACSSPVLGRGATTRSSTARRQAASRPSRGRGHLTAGGPRDHGSSPARANSRIQTTLGLSSRPAPWLDSGPCNTRCSRSVLTPRGQDALHVPATHWPRRGYYSFEGLQGGGRRRRLLTPLPVTWLRKMMSQWEYTGLTRACTSPAQSLGSDDEPADSLTITALFCSSRSVWFIFMSRPLIRARNESNGRSLDDSPSKLLLPLDDSPAPLEHTARKFGGMRLATMAHLEVCGRVDFIASRARTRPRGREMRCGGGAARHGAQTAERWRHDAAGGLSTNWPRCARLPTTTRKQLPLLMLMRPAWRSLPRNLEQKFSCHRPGPPCYVMKTAALSQVSPQRPGEGSIVYSHLSSKG